MASVDVKVLEAMAAEWHRVAAQATQQRMMVTAQVLCECADGIAEVIAGTATDEDAAGHPGAGALAGVVVGPWHLDRAGDRARKYHDLEIAGEPELAAAVMGDGGYYTWIVWEPSAVFTPHRGTAGAQALAEAAADAHLTALGATLDGDDSPCDNCGGAGWYQSTGPNGHGDPEPCDDCDECPDDERKRWAAMTGNGAPDDHEAPGDAISALMDLVTWLTGELMQARQLDDDPPTTQPLDVESITATTGPDHRVIRRDGRVIGVVDLNEVDALHPDLLNGQVVTMVVLTSGRRLPYALSVDDLAWQLGIGDTLRTGNA